MPATDKRYTADNAFVRVAKQLVALNKEIGADPEQGFWDLKTTSDGQFIIERDTRFGTGGEVIKFTSYEMLQHFFALPLIGKIELIKSQAGDRRA